MKKNITNLSKLLASVILLSSCDGGSGSSSSSDEAQGSVDEPPRDIVTLDYELGVQGNSQFIQDPLTKDGFSTGSSDSGKIIYIGGSYDDNRPQNGTGHGAVLSGANLFIERIDKKSFTVFSIDLAEYSAVFARPETVDFTGVKANGSHVNVSFTIDGVLKTGDDFERFSFPEDFKGLVSLVGDGLFSFDNVVIQ